jgi:di- and tripeptidase
MDDLVQSDDSSDVELHISSPSGRRFNEAGYDVPRKVTLRNECAMGHRVQASRSVLALVLDEECVFAGLQGGDIVVRSD